jgi:hypothetical protein
VAAQTAQIPADEVLLAQLEQRDAQSLPLAIVAGLGKIRLQRCDRLGVGMTGKRFGR